MVKNDDLKCFIRVANNGKRYKACLPKKNKPYKKKQDLRGKPHTSGRKIPQMLAYSKDPEKKKGEKKVVKKVQKNIKKLIEPKKPVKKPTGVEKLIVKKFKKRMEGKSAEEKKRLSMKMNNQLAKIRAMKPKAKPKKKGKVNFTTKDGKKISF